MEITIIEKTKTKAVFEMVGQDHTYPNLLRDELNNDKQVKAAGYAITHPFTRHPRMVVETTQQTTPKKALNAAIKRIQKNNEKILTAFKSF